MPEVAVFGGFEVLFDAESHWEQLSMIANVHERKSDTCRKIQGHRGSEKKSGTAARDHIRFRPARFDKRARKSSFNSALASNQFNYNFRALSPSRCAFSRELGHM